MPPSHVTHLNVMRAAGADAGAIAPLSAKAQTNSRAFRF